MSRSRHVNKYSGGPKPTTQIDVCILTVERTDLFAKAIEAAVKQTEEFECAYYVLNNGGPRDKQVEYDRILQHYPQVNYLRIQENVGFPAGANHLIKQGNSPLVLFVSDDVVLHNGSVNALVKRMEDFSVGLVGMKLLFPTDSVDPTRPAGKVQHVGHGVNIRAEITHPLIGWNPDNPKACQSREMASVTSAAYMMRRKAFVQAGGYFEGYGKGYFEDVDLAFTLRSMGYKVWMDADAVATHYVGATTTARGDTNGFQDNKALFLQRWGKSMTWDEFKWY